MLNLTQLGTRMAITYQLHTVSLWFVLRPVRTRQVMSHRVQENVMIREDTHQWPFMPLKNEKSAKWLYREPLTYCLLRKRDGILESRRLFLLLRAEAAHYTRSTNVHRVLRERKNTIKWTGRECGHCDMVTTRMSTTGYSAVKITMLSNGDKRGGWNVNTKRSHRLT